MIKKYISLTKPGIIGGNAIAAVGGFALASQGHIDWMGLFAMLCSLALVIASGCVFNNYIDRDIDGKMRRTQNRELVVHSVSNRGAILFAGTLLIVGLAVLALFVNILSTAIAFFGFFVYVVAYSMWAKRTTEYATEIGSIAGAVPPVVGYIAVTNSFDLPAVLLFFILCFWQMPHFFAIALRRMDEYAAASIPVFPLKRGVRATKIRILLYIFLYFVAVVLLPLFGYVGNLYVLAMVPLCLVWLWLAIGGFWEEDTSRWARKTFLFSLIILLVFASMISVDATVTPLSTFSFV